MTRHYRPNIKCQWCARQVHLGDRTRWDGATRDHVIPRSKGGRTTVWACRACNETKRNMDLETWQAFMVAHPGWWRDPKRHISLGARFYVRREEA